MVSLHEARFWEPTGEDRVRCTLCPHECSIAPGGRGACAVRYNHAGHLYTLVHDRVVARHVDPVEKKPLYHFHPGGRAYSIATVGCSLRCSFCQNHDLSQWPREHLPRHLASDARPTADARAIVCPQLAALQGAIPGEPVTPAGLVEEAEALGADMIAYTYTEPTVFFELAWDTAVLARQRGLKNVLVTNGYTPEPVVRELADVVDAVSVDLKALRPATWRKVMQGEAGPVLDAIRLYHALGVRVEVTTLVIPEMNDSDQELRAIARFVASVGRDVPWHVSRFQPAYRMRDRTPTPEATLRRAALIGHEAGLRYVYEGNMPGSGGEDTVCPSCDAVLVRRRGHSVRENRVYEGRCPECETPVPGVAMDGPLARSRMVLPRD
ncbi:MAG: radical SAM protein [Myxococcota bacterium]